MRGLCLSTVALVWLAACGPRDNANRAGNTSGAGANRTGNETGMSGDTMPATRGGAGMDTGMRMDTSMRMDTGAGARAMGGGRMADSMDAAGILTMLSTANLQEIHEGKYVERNASSAAVKALARKLVADHSTNLQKGRALAKQLGVSRRLPSDSAQANAAPVQLEGVRGAALDSVFVAHQLDAHQTNIDRIRNQMMPAAKNAALKQYLQQTLTGMEGHLRQIQQVQQRLGRP